MITLYTLGAAVFYVARRASWDEQGGPVIWDDVMVDLSNNFFEDTYFKAASSHIHFFCTSTGVFECDTVEASLKLDSIDGHNVSLYGESTSHNNIDMVFRNYVELIEAGEQLFFDTEETLFSNYGHQTSWTGFDIESLFGTTVAFFATRDSAFEGSFIQFTDLRVNVGNGFSLTDSTFTAPQDGYYYFTFSVGHAPGASCMVRLVIDDDYHAELYRSDTSPNGVTMTSRSTMVYMSLGMTAQLYLALSGSIYSDPEHSQISFAGFLYDPDKASAVAWTVHRDTDLHASDQPEDPIQFNIQEINLEGVYDPSTDMVHIDKSGYYYIEFNMGLNYRNPLTVDLLLNGVPGSVQDPGKVVGESYHKSTSHYGVYGSGKSLIVNVEQGDTLRLRLYSNTSMYCDADIQCTYLGFLLYQTN